MSQKKLWAIGGGKGGVGKSFITTNLGVYLAQQGHRVVLIDLDLGGANLHTCLGITEIKYCISDFLNRRFDSLEEVLTETNYSGLSLLSGAYDSLNVANLKYAQKVRLLRQLRKLAADFVLMDLGAGTSYNTLDFFLAADERILVIVPEPTSIENAYRFIKSAFYRQIRAASPNQSLRNLVDSIMDRNNQHGIRTPRELISHLRTLNPQIEQFIERQTKKFRPALVLNQIRTENDIRIGHAMENACLKYFGIYIDFTGYVTNHEVVRRSVLQRVPVLIQNAENEVGRNFNQLVNNLLNRE